MHMNYQFQRVAQDQDTILQQGDAKPTPALSLHRYILRLLRCLGVCVLMGDSRAGRTILIGGDGREEGNNASKIMQ
jgi:hypothetical protein